MLTFQEMYEEAQEQVQDDDATSLITIKRGINQGAKKFANLLNREWRVAKKTFGVVADQQTYQLPEDLVKVKSVVVTISNVSYPLTEVVDEDVWNSLNTTTQTSDTPELYFIEGEDEISIYPTPSTTVANAATLRYEPRVKDMTQDDYTEGTVAVTNGSSEIVGTGTTWTAKMIGRKFKVTDGSADGMWTTIAGFTDSTHLTLENYYGGTTVSGATYKIGEMPDIPEEFHESCIDYACYRYYLRRKNRILARDFKYIFQEAIDTCQENYSSKTSSQYVKPVRSRFGYVHRRRDYTVS